MSLHRSPIPQEPAYVREVHAAEARLRVPRVHHGEGEGAGAAGGWDGVEQEGQPRAEEREVEEGDAGAVRRVVAAAELLKDFGLREKGLCGWVDGWCGLSWISTRDGN